MGTGTLDTEPPVFRFPSVGEAFEWIGPELIKILQGGPLENEHEGRQLHREGIHAYGWGLSSEPEFAETVRYWHRNFMDSWIILGCRSEDVVFDKHRTGPFGKCRVKRGEVCYLADLDGATDYLRAHWTEANGPVPSWADSPLYPPPDPLVAIHEHNRLRDEQYEAVMRQRGGQDHVPKRPIQRER